MQTENRIQTIFNSISDDYDHMNDIISFNQHTIWRNRTNKEIFVKPGQKVLDLCCGTGDWTIQLAENQEAEITGLDFSGNMLKVAAGKTAQFNNITLTQGDATDLPYDDNTFDIVTIGFGLRNLPDYLSGIKEFYRVLKPGGQLVILETSNPESKLMNFGFKIYFGKIMPVLGEKIAGSGQEYTWLFESTSKFLSKEELKTMMQQNGYINIKVIPHTFGTAATHIGYKPIEAAM
ncbi:Demethylmenaquinone methyltransferase [Jeotgalicoccus aerolatus]|uniref:Demethylmenaquinone methyltransferase n=1 Tax=Jeotgalicoccus aerolatus TaxID=709510 RepID=A0ABS4HLR4_9STAP|nr:demethylmenaquinone methyltransferase [Jeotgalicoccus aerolatus]MBP1951788.1 demethylmenaquinone methyltransferase/2-methoxy-6-polyprenyl-1,4-benzoquinol methylase [Jeotgalicoccus aerolatus]GGD94785.1 demethylmenaquinone methyltransferase [Jeotgalicoccus aerolatus]CAD2075211.1 Demethylmenaquinone methyltransferase [Jeotgalicoccus aerolatus]